MLDYEGLQQKLVNQEEEFRMQNETLMQELTQVIYKTSLFCFD